jgi:hypothetical protein
MRSVRCEQGRPAVQDEDEVQDIRRWDARYRGKLMIDDRASTKHELSSQIEQDRWDGEEYGGNGSRVDGGKTIGGPVLDQK